MRNLGWLVGLLLVVSMMAGAQDYPKVEIFGGYTYNHQSIGGTGFNFNGGSTSSTTGSSSSSSSGNAFAIALGGGLDAKVSPHIAIRVAQVDYLLTKFQDDQDNRQNNVRVSAGIVFRWGK